MARDYYANTSHVGAFVVGLEMFFLGCRGFPFQLRVTSRKTLYLTELNLYIEEGGK
jgi:hypothetical protein